MNTLQKFFEQIAEQRFSHGGSRAQNVLDVLETYVDDPLGGEASAGYWILFDTLTPATACEDEDESEEVDWN